MHSKAAVLAGLFALADARFGQESLIMNDVQALSSFGESGQAGTLAGQTPGVLLAGANACAKLSLADDMVTTLGNDPQVLAAAAKLVAAEQNFNPFAVSVPKICSDPSLPATEPLRGILPLVDPAVDGAAAQNARSAASLASPLDAAGRSVADLMAANGFSNFVPQDSAGRTGAVAGAGSSGSGNAGNVNDAGNAKAGVAKGSNAGDTKAVDSETDDTKAPKNPNNANTGTAGADFGRCMPTMDFKGGRAGRKADEFTFLPTDPLVAQGQQDALNPNIITTRICDQLTNVCGANDAAKAACQAAKAKVQALGTRDASTAAAFNSALGF